MKKRLFLLPLLALAQPAAAQHTELVGRFGLGLFHFSGPDAEATSFINYSNFRGYDNGYTNSPFGSRLGTGFALGGRVQRVGRRRGLLAFDLGYDWLRSRTTITDVYYSAGYANQRYAATGTTSLRTQNLTAFLGLGHQFQLSTLRLDVLAGPELAVIFGMREKGRGTYNGTSAWATDADRSISVPVDARLRADATVWQRRVGFNASYSVGFANYQSGLVGASPEVYSRTLRLGLAYRLR